MLYDGQDLLGSLFVLLLLGGVQTVVVLAFANTTKPLRRCYGLVVLANANVSAIPRVHGSPGEMPIFGSIQIYPAHPPLTQISNTR
jgi:hypothetical protein